MDNHLFVFPLTSIYFAIGEFFFFTYSNLPLLYKGWTFFCFSSSNLLLWNGWTIVFNILMFHSFEVMKWFFSLQTHSLMKWDEVFFLSSNISFLLKWLIIMYFFQLSSPLEWVHKLFFSLQPLSPWNGWTTYPFDHFFSYLIIFFEIDWGFFLHPFVFKNQCTFPPPHSLWQSSSWQGK